VAAGEEKPAPVDAAFPRASKALTRVAMALLVLLATTNSGVAAERTWPSVAELADASAVVLLGEVVGKRHAIDADGNPWTSFVVQPIDVLLGSVDDSVITIRCYGGPVADGYVTANGTPSLEQGERWLLFYNPDDPFCQLSGWGEGAFLEVPLPGGRRTLANAGGRTLLMTGPGAGRALGAPVDIRWAKPRAPVGSEAVDAARTDLGRLPSTASLLQAVSAVCSTHNRRARAVRSEPEIAGRVPWTPAPGEPQ
jgi:hypothetical protein